jgi:UDP-N-acetyl-D-glucosamine dehydrogenase
MRNYSFDLSSVELTKETLKTYEATILVTDHDDYDYDLILKNSKLIIDCRGTFPRKAVNVVRA